MFEDNVNSLLTKAESEKHLVISFSLLMKLFEWCHDEAKDDVDMHRVMEKLVAFNDGVNPLTIDVYDCLMADVQPCEQDCASVEPSIEQGLPNGGINAFCNCCNNDNVFVDHGYQEMDLDSILGTAKPMAYFKTQTYEIPVDDKACDNHCDKPCDNAGIDAETMNQINQVLSIAR